MKDRPLTDAQERCLVALADAFPAWKRNPARNVTTLEALKRQGLAEFRFYAPLGSRYIGYWEARITPAGLELLNTMGD